MQAAGLTTGNHRAAVASAAGDNAAQRPVRRGLGDGNTQAITITGGHFHSEGFRLRGKALTVGREFGCPLNQRCIRIEALVQIAKTVLDFLVGVVDIAGHLALQHAHAVENLPRFGKALLHTTAGLIEELLQFSGIGTGGLFTAQALLDKAENAPGDFLRGVVIGLAGQCPWLQAEALGQTIGKNRLRVGSIAHNRLGSGRGRT